MNKRIVLALILTGCLVFLAPHLPQVSAATVEELQSQIQQLLQIIQQLQQQLNALINSQSQQPGGPYCFSQTLRYGMTSPEVKNLQIVLGVSPTGYFGDLTLAALKEFQQANNIRVTGEVGPETREVLNSKYCVPVIPTTTTKPITSSCGWCGNTCVRKTVGMSCPDVMPPLGVECKEVNGVCTIVPLVPTTKYSCVTARGTIPTNIYSTCIPDTNGTFNSLEECQRECRVSVTCTDSDGGWNLYQKGTIYINNQAVCTDNCETSQTLIECNCGNPSGGGPDLGYSKSQINCPSGYTCQDGACKASTTSYIQIVSPNGGEKWEVGKTYTIRWDTTLDSSHRVAIGLIDTRFSSEGGSRPEQTIASSVPNTGSYAWNIPKMLGILDLTVTTEPVYKIKLYLDGGGAGQSTMSSNPFSIIPSTPLAACFDFDGDNIFTKSQVVAYTEDYIQQTYTDSCVNSNTVTENICIDSKHSTHTAICPSGYTCQDGACKPSTSQQCVINSFTANPPALTWASSSPSFSNSVTLSWNTSNCSSCYVTNGSVGYWPTNNSNNVTLYNVKDTTIFTLECSGQNNTTTKQLTVNVAQTQIPCTDSDGGMNIYVKGHTIGYNPQAEANYRNVDIWDKCYNDRSVYEYGCRDGYFNSGLYDCPSGYTCQDGACKPSTPPTTIVPTCTDSDGYQPFVKGTVNYGGQILTDSCSSSTVIKEYICSNGMPNAVESTCPTGSTCQDGACKPTVATTIPSSGRCSDGSVCSWCGNQCVKFTSGMQCPTVMPPQGANCTCVNNTCTVQYGPTSLMNVLNKLSASLASLIELLKR